MFIQLDKRYPYRYNRNRHHRLWLIWLVAIPIILLILFVLWRGRRKRRAVVGPNQQYYLGGPNNGFSLFGMGKNNHQQHHQQYPQHQQQYQYPQGYGTQQNYQQQNYQQQYAPRPNESSYGDAPPSYPAADNSEFSRPPGPPPAHVK